MITKLKYYLLSLVKHYECNARLAQPVYFLQGTGRYKLHTPMNLTLKRVGYKRMWLKPKDHDQNPGVSKLQSSAIISGTNWIPAHVRSYFTLYYKTSSITILSSDITNARAHVSYTFTSSYHLHDHNWLTAWAGVISESPE